MDEKKDALVPEVMPAGTAIEAYSRAEIDVQIATAKKYPRSISVFQKKVLDMAMLDKDTAEECMYALPRDGRVIEGPSVRFAEIVATAFGNLRVAQRVVAIEDDFLVCQAVAHDLEANVAVQTEVRRRIVDKNKRRYSEDMIVTTANAGCSIAGRNAIFKVVPKALTKSVLDQIHKLAMGKDRSLAESRKAMLAYWAAQGIKKEQVLSLLQKKDEADITLEDVDLMRKTKVAIDEGTTTLQETFQIQNAGTDPLAPGKHRPEPKPQETKEEAKPEPAPSPAAPSPAPPDPEPKPEKPPVEPPSAPGPALITPLKIKTLLRLRDEAKLAPENFAEAIAKGYGGKTLEELTGDEAEKADAQLHALIKSDVEASIKRGKAKNPGRMF